jgi:hypothetical protein
MDTNPISKEKIIMTETKDVTVVDQELIDRSVEFINEKIMKTVYKGSIEIGEYILKHFYNDDINLVRSRSPFKSVSFQELCKRDDLGVGPSMLSRMLNVASQERYFLQNNANLEGLSYSHRVELVRLDDNEDKLKHLEKCIQEKMPLRTFREYINNIIPIGIKEPTPLKLISNVEKLIDNASIEKLASQTEKLEGMTPKTRAKIRERVDDLLKKMDDITRECSSFMQTLDKIEKKKDEEKRKKEIEKEEKKKERAQKAEERKKEKEKKEEEKKRKAEENKKSKFSKTKKSNKKTPAKKNEKS